MKTPTAATDSVHCIDPTSLPSSMDDLSKLVSNFGSATARLEALLPPRTRMDVARFVQVAETHASEEIEKIHGLLLDLAALSPDRKEPVASKLSELELATFYRMHAELIIDLDKRVDGGDLAWPLTADFTVEMHRRLYEHAPSGVLRARLEDGSIALAPAGRFRAEERDDVVVGLHRPPRSALLPDFLNYWERSFREQSTKTESLVCAVLAHHRLLYIHPFLAGNGRIARLALRATLRHLGFAGSGLWSLSRALLHDDYLRSPANNYVFELRHANVPGEDGDLGRDRSARFVIWLLLACLREMDRMQQMLAPGSIVKQFSNYAKAAGLAGDASRLVEIVLESEAGQVLPSLAIEKLGLSSDAGEALIQDLRARNVVLIGRDSGTLRLKMADKGDRALLSRFPLSAAAAKRPRQPARHQGAAARPEWPPGDRWIRRGSRRRPGARGARHQSLG